MNRRSRFRPQLALALEPLEARTLMAWKVLGADAQTLTIGEPDDGDVGVLSYDPEIEHFLLDGVDTGVKPEHPGGRPNVRVSTDGANDTTFVVDASEAGFPVVDGCFAFGYCAPLGTYIEYDGSGNDNALRFRGHELYSGRVDVRPFRGGLGSISFVAERSRNDVFYRNFEGK
jgi:hypothetical protein